MWYRVLAAIALLCSGSPAIAQNNLRYFTGVYGLLEDIETDAVLKETRAGAKLVSAELDVCHAPTAGSPLRDRFVVTLKPQGNRLVGSGQGQDSKTPVSVDLVRTASGGNFSFEGTIKYGDRVFKASSGEVSDLSAKEFQEQTVVDETIVENPADFREVTPNTIAFRVTRAALADFLKSLRGENVRVQAYSIAPSCEALRRGHMDVQADIDPERAADLVAKAKSFPGVTRAGWTSGGVDLTRAIRIPAAGLRDTEGKLDREKIGKAIAGMAGKVFSGEAETPKWDEVTGEMTLVVRRPDRMVPGLGLTEVIGVPVIVGSEKPRAKEILVIRIGQIESQIEDAGSGPRLAISGNQGNGEAPEPAGSDALQAALARELKGEIWDADKERWVK